MTRLFRYAAMVFALSLVLPFWPGAQAHALTVDRCELVAYGTYHVVQTGEMVSEGGSGGNSDVHQIRDLQLLEQTDRAPIIDGVTIGMDYIFRGSPHDAVIPLHVRVLYPNGRVLQGEDRTRIDFKKHTSITLHDMDMPEGWYTIEVQYQGRVMVSKQFYLFHPSGASNAPAPAPTQGYASDPNAK